MEDQQIGRVAKFTYVVSLMTAVGRAMLKTGTTGSAIGKEMLLEGVVIDSRKKARDVHAATVKWGL